mgnify:CR=1 FL=1
MAKKNNSLEKLVNELDELGYFNQCAPEAVDDVKKKALYAKCIYGIDGIKRDYVVDFEDLTEFGARSFLLKIKPFLKKAGVKIKSIQQNIDSQIGYVMSINNVDYLLYDWKELRALDLWKRCAVRIFDIINEILDEANSKERLYLLFLMDEIRIIFLTEEMYAAIVASSTIKNDEKPFSIEEYILMQTLKEVSYRS